MRTPAGSECPYYYADFHRGANRQVCRLIERNPAGGKWEPGLCAGCPVPRIVQANGCPNLLLEASARRGVLGLGRGVSVRARCTLSGSDVAQPEVGCGRCHNLPFTLQD